MTQHSLLKALKIVFVCFTLIHLMPFHSLSQSNYGCPIIIDGNESISSIRSAPRNMSMATNYASGFVELENISGRDNLTSKVKLKAKKSSDVLYANDFGFSLPDGVNILGVDVRIFGSASIPGVIRDSRLSLASGPGISLGTDKANRSTGTPWGENSNWSYGSTLDDWGATLTAATINNPGFGIMLQISNRGEESVDAEIDQISVRVYYQSSLEICGHPCVAVMSYDDPAVASYNWNVDSGLDSEVSNQQDNILNIFADQSAFGEYQICLTRNFLDGTMDNCCRPINYTSCDLGSIGNYVWEDTNGNGIQDAGESGLDNFIVRLYNGSGKEIANTFTVNGNYSFTDLKSGFYFVQVDPRDYTTSIYNGSNPDTNSDIQNLYYYGSTGIIDLAPGENRDDIDLGLTQYGSICGHAYNDRDGDGWENDLDVDLSDVTVNLYDGNCIFLRSVSTDAAGDFCFDNLGAGSYYIDYDLSEGYFPSAYGLVNIVDPSTGKIKLDLLYGESSSGNDIGAYRLSQIGNFVWNDANNNGLQDIGEEGIAGVEIAAYSCADVFINSVISDSDGHYLITGLNPGSYKICVGSSPSGYIPTIQTADANGSDVGADGCSDCIDLLDDISVDDLDIGFIFGSADIGDLVWLDENRNGVLDQSEHGVSDVTVSLQDCAGNIIQETVTGAAGNYLFEDVPAGDYVICLREDLREIIPASVSGCTTCFSHTGTADDLGRDLAMVYELASVDAKVWIDANSDGIRDDNEELVEGILTELYTCDGVLVGSAPTDNIGGSWFINLEVGDYYIRTVLPQGYEFITNGGEVTGQNGLGTSDCFPVQGIGRTINVGLIRVEEPKKSLCVNVWDDENLNNAIDLGEQRLPDVNIEVYTCLGVLIGSMVSDGANAACLEDFPAGDYYLRVDTPEGYLPSVLGAVTSDFGPGTTRCIVDNDQDVTVNLAFVSEEVEEEEEEEEAQTQLDARLWVDANSNGVREDDELPLIDVRVNLYSCLGLLIAEAFTDSEGAVTFDGLSLGQYYIQAELFPGLDFTTGGIITSTTFGPGSSDCFDLDENGLLIEVVYVPITSALRANISGKVWLDENEDGIMDLSELGMEAVDVRLYDASFLPLETTTTNAGGIYSFQDLNFGSYYVQFVTPGGYLFTEYRMGNNAAVDSEVIDAELGMTDVVVLTTTQGMDDVNAGLVESEIVNSRVGGRVWIDENENGIIDIAESGYSESLVILFEENGDYHSSTFTDEEGHYNFPLLPVGRYYIAFDLPLGYNYTTAKAGGVSQDDSEVIDIVAGTTLVFELQSATGISGINAGLQKITAATASISGKVWIDNNGNNLLDPSEAGYSDMLIVLYDDNGTYQYTTFTQGDGTYSFPQIEAGRYYVDFELPDGYDYSVAQIANNNQDSEVIDFAQGTTGVYDLQPGENLNDVHVGLQEIRAELASIAGRVWIDADSNDLDDGFEQGYADMLILLLDDTDAIVTSVYTDQDGSYTFGQLAEGDYYVDFELPDGYTYSRAQIASNDIDSEVVDLASGTTAIYTLGAGQNIMGINAGLQVQELALGSIEGSVWQDNNNNNLYDTDESGYKDLLVLLFDDQGNYQASTFTNINGAYAFPLLNPGRYRVDFDLPVDYLFVSAKAGGISDIDSEVTDLSLGTTDLIDVAGTSVTGVNAGIRQPTILLPSASVSGRVWNDEDADGLIGITESGIEGVEVQLYNEANELVATINTIWSGHYEFLNLHEGNYYVNFDLKGDRYSEPQVEGTSNRDSEVVDIAEGNTAVFILSESQQLSGINAGMITDPLAFPATIEGMVWLDTNADGLLGIGEDGLAGIGVSLIDENNDLVSEIFTGFDGTFQFGNLVAGLYYLEFDADNYNFTLPKAGGNSTADSEVVNRVDGFTTLYILAEGQTISNINAGLTEIPAPQLASLGGLVWIDADEDGLADATELGADKVTVTLMDVNNEVVATTETIWTGKYEFTDLTAGLYYVRFQAAGFNFTVPQSGGNSLWDSEVVNAIGGNTGLYILAQGEELIGINAGIVHLPEEPATMAGIVWMDSDQDGMINNGEEGVASVVVHLIDVNNDIVESQTTTNDGLYEFDNIVPGLYYFRYEIQDNTFFTIAKAGGNSELDSEVVNTSNANTALYILSAGQVLTGINAGIYQESIIEPVSIAGRVWLDEDKDGLISGSESGVENVSVELMDENNQRVNSLFTDAAGAYSFDNLVAGLYYVRFVIADSYDFTDPQVSASSMLDSEVLNAIEGNTSNYVLAAGDRLEGINAGLVEKDLGTDDNICGIVWEDLDGNGILSPDEFGSAGIAVRLLDSDNNLVSIVSTDGLGAYCFSGLNVDAYYVQFSLPLDSKATKRHEGNNTRADSDIDETGLTELITVNVSDLNGMNAGYYYPVSIGNWVWLDLNEDGIQSPDEPGANNYIINLYDADDNSMGRVWSNYNELVQPGYYSFNDLAPGSYYIKVTPQSGIDFSPSAQTSDAKDSDLTGSNGFGSSDTFFLASGMSTEDKDIGLVLAPANLGDRLWIDENGDGIQDDNENGLNGVVVELYNSFGIQVGSTITKTMEGEDGYYLFEELYPTEYYIKFILDGDYIATVADVGGVDSKDSDIDNSNGPGTTSIFLLSPGETDLDLDGGVYLNAFIGDKVWHDKDKDGMQDSNEPGVENVEISLYEVNNGVATFLATTLSDRFGEYRFSNLANGDYYLTFLPADDFEMTEMDMGMDDAADSDASKTGVTSIITIVNNTSVSNVDVGLIRPDNQISGYAWLDLNKNGTYETDEAFVEGIAIWLMQGATFISEEVTGPGGRYLFDDLDNVDYYLKVNLPSDYDFTIPNFGIEEDVNSDFDSAGSSETYSFTGSDVYRNVNLGLIDISKNKSILYPNPIIGTELNVSAHIYKEGLDASYEILGSMGQVISSGTWNSNQTKGQEEFSIPVDGLDEGIYFLKLKIGRQVENIKFTKLSR